MNELAISVRDLAKTYRTPFRRKRVEALRGVTFEVPKGEIFGFLGPNGAGKTTTIRSLMGLIRPTSGSATLLGEPIGTRTARNRVGFLPEQPYFYDYLSVSELCDLVGRLFGLDASTRKRRADELIAKVGLEKARNTALKKYSKGMLQRAGLAQALMNDPDLIVMDEPMSGLDPIGRKEVRDLILELRDRKKTVFFSTHILADVEAIANRLAIVSGGQVTAQGVPHELIARTVLSIDVVVRANEETKTTLDSKLSEVGRRIGEQVTYRLPAQANIDAALAHIRDAGGSVVSVVPHHETLEDLFLRQTNSKEAA